MRASWVIFLLVLILKTIFLLALISSSCWTSFSHGQPTINQTTYSTSNSLSDMHLEAVWRLCNLQPVWFIKRSLRRRKCVKSFVRKCKWKLSSYLKTMQKFFIVHLLLINPSVQIQLLKALTSSYLFSVNVMLSLSDKLILCLVNCIQNLTVNVSLPNCEIDFLPLVLTSYPHSDMMLLIARFANVTDWVAAIQLLLSGDIESNPGPTTFREGEICYCYWGDPALLYKAKLIDSRINDNSTEFLVHYVGFNARRNEWVRVTSLEKDCPETELLKRTLEDRHKRKGSSGNLAPPVVSPAVSSVSPCVSSSGNLTTSTSPAVSSVCPSVSLSDKLATSVSPSVSSVNSTTESVVPPSVSSTPIISVFPTSASTLTTEPVSVFSKTSTNTTDSVTHPVCATSISNSVGTNGLACCSNCRDNNLLLSALQTKLDQHILMTDIKLRDLQESNAALISEITVLRSLLPPESCSDADPSSGPTSSHSSNPSATGGGSKDVNDRDSVSGFRSNNATAQANGQHANVTRRVGRYRNEIFGSSIIRDTGNLLSTPNTCVFPRGGARITNIHATVNSLSEQATRETNSILFHVGGNDLHMPTNTILQDYEKLLVLTKSRFPLAHIVVSAPLLRYNIAVEKVVSVNCELRKLCSEYGVEFLDANSLFSPNDFYDGIHLRKYGKLRLAGAFDQVLSRFVPKNGTAPVWNNA
jgi:RNA binding activity-knot of a chromodomain